MVHPSFKRVEGELPLPASLTPVYPASAQLPQAYLRKAVASALVRAPLHELLPPDGVPAGLPPLREALTLLHQPPARMPLEALEDRSHPAWQRLKYEELLAQQLAQAQALADRAQLRAPTLHGGGLSLTQQLLATLPFGLALANHGLEALNQNPHLARGLNVLKGEITYPAVAEALGLKWSDPYGVWAKA
jgi:ATP-dependent DNA helicase RecG